jgi:hypothetical protein
MTFRKISAVAALVTVMTGIPLGLGPGGLGDVGRAHALPICRSPEPGCLRYHCVRMAPCVGGEARAGCVRWRCTAREKVKKPG